jgi:hypothetical protein
MKILKESRWKYFPKLFKDLGYTVGAEIGVELGAFSKQLIQDNPDLKLYCIDFWKAYIYKGTGPIRSGKSQPRQDSYYERAKVKLAPYNCEIIKDSSMSAVKGFADESLDFVYIDAAHDYDHVKEDIREWSKKVRMGGIVSGHDYAVFPSGNDGIIRAVDEWVKENDIDLIVLDDKKRSPSWYYIK